MVRTALVDAELAEALKERRALEGGRRLFRFQNGECGPAESEAQAKKAVAATCRAVAEKLGNTPAVCRASYISPAVIDQYIEGRTLDDFRPRHLRVVSARDTGLEPEERALLSLLRSWRIREARKAAEFPGRSLG